MMTNRIEDYAIIGNCETAALVGRDGSIDWLSMPRFDSGACFAALLGDARHGRWQIMPARRDDRGTARGSIKKIEPFFAPMSHCIPNRRSRTAP